jgi:hypothetical protein
VHVKVGQAATVRMKGVSHFEGEGLAEQNLSIRAARTQVAVSSYRRHARLVGRHTRALNYNTVGLLVADAQLTQDSQALNVKVVNEPAETAQEEALLLVHK